MMETPQTENTVKMPRDEMRARSALFDRFALKDQKSYYRYSVERHGVAVRQVRFMRAAISFFTGAFAALAGLLVQVYFLGDGACVASEATTTASYCGALSFGVGLATLLAIALPAFGGAFGTLADLYQWDRLVTIYDTALKNLQKADALSPVDSIPDDMTYRASMRAFAEGALQVMNDETAQWGQSVRQPRQLQLFIEEEQTRAERARNRILGDSGGRRPNGDPNAGG